MVPCRTKGEFCDANGSGQTSWIVVGDVKAEWRAGHKSLEFNKQDA
jgi:hypothetical protein